MGGLSVEGAPYIAKIITRQVDLPFGAIGRNATVTANVGTEIKGQAPTLV